MDELGGFLSTIEAYESHRASLSLSHIACRNAKIPKSFFYPSEEMTFFLN